MHWRTVPTTLTVGDLKRMLEKMDDRMKVFIENGQELMPLRGVVHALHTDGTDVVLVLPNLPGGE